IAMANSVEMLEVMFGIVKAGACAVPLSSLLSPEAIATLIDDSDACAIFVAAPLDKLVLAGEAGLAKLRPDARFSHGFAAPGWRDLGGW
ncbi:AMP-binding protein, partial [Salmonella enterica]|uniref:AMP-binding protein n=1 Tax=Salmonella enterica TaxID=28901 RepID=UPI003D2E534F